MSIFERFNFGQGKGGDERSGEPATLADAARQARAEAQDFRARENSTRAALENEGLPSVNRKRGTSRLINVLGLLVILGFGAAMIVAVNSGKGGPARKKNAEGPDKIANHLPPLFIPAAPPPLALPPAPIPSSGPQGSPIQPGIPGAPPLAAQPQRGPDGKPMLDWSDRKMTGGVVEQQSATAANPVGYGNGGFDNGIYSGMGQGASARPMAGAPAVNRTAPYADRSAQHLAALPGGSAGAGADSGAQGGPALMAGGGSSGSELALRLEPSVAKAVSAALLPDRNFLITQGTSLDCALETALDSSVPGLTTCRLTRDVYSNNGQVLLLDRGSKLVGEYQSGVQRGQRRIFVLWTRAETPTGVVVQLNSPGTDALGRSGLEGWVDSHFLERFGAAILMSFVSDSVAALRHNDHAGVTNYYGNTVNSGSKVVEKMLESTANIPSTLVKNPGEHIQVMVARDLDFSGVYGLALKH